MWVQTQEITNTMTTNNDIFRVKLILDLLVIEVSAIGTYDAEIIEIMKNDAAQRIVNALQNQTPLINFENRL